jgi:hypothetical protein
MTKIMTMICAIILPGVAAAHPDHASGGDFGHVHFLTDPFHVGLTVLAALVLLAVRRSMPRRRSLDRPGQ